MGSGLLIKKSIKKYGKENFVRETLEFCTSGNINEQEIYWIENLSATDLNIGYNLENGGYGHQKINEIIKLKMKQNHANFLGPKNPNYGNKWTEEQKRNLSLKMKGRYSGENNPNYGNGEKIKGSKNPMFGKKHSQSVIQNIILKSNKKYYYNFISPTNQIYKKIYLIQNFCQTFNLNYQGVYYAVKHSGYYKGWQVTRELINSE